MSDTMQAIVIEAFGSPSVLQATRLKRPEPQADEVLLRIHATAVNTIDTFRRTGIVPTEYGAPLLLGCDAAGEVAGIGAAVTEWQIGDRVVVSWPELGKSRDGTYAEYVVVPEDHLRHVPDSLDFTTAASSGTPFTMAWIGLRQTASITAQDRVVIHAGGGNTSAAAIQIAAQVGAQVLVIAESDQHEQLRQLGASLVIDQRLDVIEAVKLATDGQGASLVLDVLGKDTLGTALDIVTDGGRVVCLDTLSGDFAAIDIRALIDKHAQLLGASGTLKAKEHYGILTQFADGTLRPMVEATLPLSAAAEAHRRLEAEQHWGQFILVPDALYTKPGQIRVEIE